MGLGCGGWCWATVLAAVLAAVRTAVEAAGPKTKGGPEKLRYKKVTPIHDVDTTHPWCSCSEAGERAVFITRKHAAV